MIGLAFEVLPHIFEGSLEGLGQRGLAERVIRLGGAFG
jgi:hypothetical protein